MKPNKKSSSAALIALAIILLINNPQLFSQSNKGQDYFDKGLTLRDKGDYEGAIRLIRKAVQIEPQNKNYLLVLAEIYGWEKDFSKATSIYKIILNLDPGNLQASLGLARVLVWNYQWSDAERIYKSILKKHPNDPGANFGLGQLLYWQGYWGRAKKLFQRTLELYPQHELARKALSELKYLTSPQLTFSLYATTDDQPVYSEEAKLLSTFHITPHLKFSLGLGAFGLENVQIGGRFEAYSVLFMFSKNFPSLKMSIDVLGGAKSYASDRVSPQVKLGIAQTLLKVFRTKLYAKWERSDYTIVAQALKKRIYLESISLESKTHLKRYWLCSLGGKRTYYSDSNQGTSLYAWTLFPVWRRPFEFQVGYGYSYQTTDSSRFMLREVTSSFDKGAGIYRYNYQSFYDPYWTPKDFRSHNLILKAALPLGKRWSVTGSLSYSLYSQDKAIRFLPENGPSPFPEERGIKQFIRRGYHPINIVGEFTLRLEGDSTLRFSYRFFKTIYYRANYIVLSFDNKL